METSKLDQLRIEREPEKEPGSWRWLPAVAGVLVLAGGLAWWVFKPAATLGVQTAVAREVSKAAANTVLNASGYVTARRQATVSSKFTGKVREVLIEEGMRVEQDEVLARLDDANVRTSFDLAEAQLRSAEFSRKETGALLKEARANFTRTVRDDRKAGRNEIRTPHRQIR